jgi:uncharacterized membrane protein
MGKQELSSGRLEAFSDGVIAVIITIMVLELHVPVRDGWAGVRGVGFTVLLYLLTFVQVGVYWINHHYLIDETDAVTHGILWANLIFLFSLSLFPFATEWMGVKGLSSFSAALYAAVSLMPAVSFAALWLAVRRASKVAPHASWAKMVASTVLYVAAIPAAYVRPWMAMGLIGVVAVLWVMPPRGEVDPSLR